MEEADDTKTLARLAEKLVTFASLEEDDRYFSSFLENSFDCWRKKLSQGNPSLSMLFASGAALEGGWSADTCPGSNELVINIDIFQPFIFLRGLSAKDLDRRLVEETKTGAVNIKLLNIDLSDAQSLRELAMMDSTDGEWYLSPKQCLELFAYHCGTSESHQVFSHLHDAQMFLETMLISLYQEEENDSLPGFDFHVWDVSPKVRAKIKTIPCINCASWAHFATEWPRDTQWPGEELVQSIKNGGYHLVRDSANLQDLPLSWRVNFAKAEKKLLKTFAPNQRKCYIGLKKFLNGISTMDRGIGGNLLRTLMFWDAEMYGPDNEIWANEINVCMERLLLKLRASIKKGVCDHYFIAGMNILETLSVEQRENVLSEFFDVVKGMGSKDVALNASAIGKVNTIVDAYPKREAVWANMEEHIDLFSDALDADGDQMMSIFTNEFLESTYEKYVRVNMATTKKEKARAAQCRSKFYHALVALYALALALNYGLISCSTHSSLMMFLTFLVAGLLLNLGWPYRWSLCFLYSVMSLDSAWSLNWKVAHFVLAFPLAKFISQMMALFERPLEKPAMKATGRESPTMALTGTVAKPGLTAPMLFLYGVNLLLMCGSKSNGLRTYWDVVVCTLANHGHFIVFCPWMELFYRDYNRLVVRLRPAICSTVCTSLFVMFMLHYSDYNKAFWPWFVMTSLTIALCCFMCYSLPNRLAIPIYCLFGLMLFLPAKILYTVMVILYAAYWSFLPWHSMPFTRALRVLTLLCVHLCLQTTSLTDILASVNLVFGCSMYIGCLYSFYSAEVLQKNASLLRRITSTLMLGTFVGGVALLAFQSKPASTQEAFIEVSAPVSAAMMLHSLEGTLLQTIYKLFKRIRARDGGVANHT